MEKQMEEQTSQIVIKGKLYTDPTYAFNEHQKGDNETEIQLWLAENKEINFYIGFLYMNGKSYFAVSKLINNKKAKVLVFTGEKENLEFVYDITNEGVNCSLMYANIIRENGKDILQEKTTKFGCITKTERMVDEKESKKLFDYVNNVVLDGADKDKYNNFIEEAKKIFLDRNYVPYYSMNFKKMYDFDIYQGYTEEKPIDIIGFSDEIEKLCQDYMRFAENNSDDRKKEELQYIKKLARDKLESYAEMKMCPRSFYVISRIIDLSIDVRVRGRKDHSNFSIVFAQMMDRNESIQRYSMQTPEQIYANNLIRFTKNPSQVLGLFYEYGLKKEDLEEKELGNFLTSLKICDPSINVLQVMNVYFTIKMLCLEKGKSVEEAFDEVSEEIYLLQKETNPAQA